MIARLTLVCPVLQTSSSRSRKPTWTSSCRPSPNRSWTSPCRRRRAWRSPCPRANRTGPSRSRPWVPARSQRVSRVLTDDDSCFTAVVYYCESRWTKAAEGRNNRSFMSPSDGVTPGLSHRDTQQFSCNSLYFDTNVQWSPGCR